MLPDNLFCSVLQTFGLSDPQIVALSNSEVLSYFLSLSSGILHLSPLSQNPVNLLYGIVNMSAIAVTVNKCDMPWYTISL